MFSGDMLVCSCKIKIKFEIDAGKMFDIDSLENVDCGGANECLSCAEIDSATVGQLEDGIYTAVANSSTWSSFNGESTEYDGETILDDVKLVKRL